MVVKRALVVFWCVFSCVTCETTGVQFVKPTPVLDNALTLRSTDARNPLKFNKESVHEPLSTSFTTPLNENGLVNPTPLLLGITTTGAADPVIDNDDSIPQFTHPSDIQPTSVINVPVIFETDSNYPLNINIKPVITASTGIIEDSFLNPTPVIKTVETAPAVIPLTNDDAPEAPSTTAYFNIIEPSTVLKPNEEPVTAVATPDLVEEKPNEVLSMQPISPTLTQSVSTCTCTFYEDLKPFSLDWLAPGHSHPHHHKYHGSKMKASHSSINIYQKFLNLHFNFFVNNNPIPILSANMYPYY